MLAPIVTKDMKLFPARPLPPRIKNVRSRAQSLQDFADANARKQSQVKQQSTRQRNAQSVGNLSSVSNRSPPKGSLIKRKPLDAIAEGVEMPAPIPTTASTPAMYNHSTASVHAHADLNGNGPERFGKLAKFPPVDLAKSKNAKDLKDLKDSPNDENRPDSVVSTVSSAPSTSGEHLQKTSRRSSTHSNDDMTSKPPLTAGLLKFITNSLKGGSKKEKVRKCHEEAQTRHQKSPASPTVP